MKDNLFEILLELCEKSLAQLQKNQLALKQEPIEALHEEQEVTLETQSIQVKSAKPQSTRVVTQEERFKLTKASYQFLMRMKRWGVIDADFFELLMNQLSFSDSRFITEQETKWTMRTLLANELSEDSLAFLDLVLYQKEDEHTTH